MALIKSISEVRKYLRVNYTNAETSIPNMDQAARKFIIPFIGQELYDDLQTQYDAGSALPAFVKLLRFVQAALVPLAYCHELPLINTQITDLGLKKSISQDTQPIFKHDFYKLQAMLLENGSDGIEAMLTFLEKNSADYPLWMAAEERKDYRSLIVRNATEFRRVYALVHPQRCYMLLQPCIREAQEQYIIPSIGGPFFKELLDIAVPTEEEKRVIELLQRAVVYLSMLSAPAHLSVSLTSTGFTVQSADADLAEPNRTAANESAILRMLQHTERSGLGCLRQAKELLNEKASSITFATYFNSSYYANPAMTKPSLNSQLKSTFAT